jgi:hypothetical protein
MPTLLRFVPVALIAAVLAIPVAHAQPPAKDKPVDPDHAAKMARGTELFKSSVRGVIAAKCLKCHSGEKVEGEFDLGTRESLLKGGPGGPAVVPGDHKKSLLYQLVAHQKQPHMPHERAKLPDAEIARIAEWIDLGAPYDKPFLAKEDASAWVRKVVAPDAKAHWAFKPLARLTVPSGVHPVDHFLGAKLAAAGLKPNPPAEKRVLLRRAYLDLIGLPPTPEQVDAFLKDDSPQAFEKVVDELLASPRHGERWARHWLDLVRFAESHGFEHDYDRPSAYHYRDFVIRALNADLPFDTFARWQLAGDELAPSDPLALMATGYLAAGVHSTQITQSEVEKHRYDELDDILANIGTTSSTRSRHAIITGCWPRSPPPSGPRWMSTPSPRRREPRRLCLMPSMRRLSMPSNATRPNNSPRGSLPGRRPAATPRWSHPGSFRRFARPSPPVARP